MFKVKTLITAALIAVVSLFGSLAAYAGQQDFKLVNATGSTVIAAVYISPVTTDDWEEDVLGDNLLKVGEVAKIGFPNELNSTYWDIKLVDSNGRSYIFKGLNLKTIFRLTFYWDSNKGEYRLKYDYLY